MMQPKKLATRQESIDLLKELQFLYVELYFKVGQIITMKSK